FGGGRQQLTLVYVGDLAAIVGLVLTHPKASREIFFVGSREIVTAGELVERVAIESGCWTISLPLPNAALWIACQCAGQVARLTGKATVLNAQKYAELKAAGWVCDVSKLNDKLEGDCPTSLREGVMKT